MSMQDEQFESPRWDYMDRERFLKHYKLKLAKEFSQDGEDAEWAQNGHRYWDDEDEVLYLKKPRQRKDENEPDGTAALSPDSRLLAISGNAVIRIFDVKTKHVVSKLKGHKDMVRRMHFAPQTTDNSGSGAAPAYTLISSCEHMRLESQTFIWHLDSQGLHHGPLKMMPGDLTSFGLANPISKDGSKVVTLEKNQSTQQGMRPLEDMPRIVLRDMDSLREVWRLTGHQDAIMWAGISPDDKWIAEACWDQTFGIWNPRVRDRAEGHLIGPTDGQNWMGDFSADGKYIVFSGGSPTKVAIYNVNTGEEIAALSKKAWTGHSSGWVREIQWSPVDYSVALVVDQRIIVWRPLEGSAFTSVFEVETDGSMLTRYNSLITVKWVDEGRKLVVKDMTNTIYVWDMKLNMKWRLQKPYGLGLDLYATEVFFVKDMSDYGTIVSLDGDWKVRFWDL